jgi:hypothetical protein
VCMSSCKPSTVGSAARFAGSINEFLVLPWLECCLPWLGGLASLLAGLLRPEGSVHNAACNLLCWVLLLLQGYWVGWGRDADDDLSSGEVLRGCLLDGGWKEKERLKSRSCQGTRRPHLQIESRQYAFIWQNHVC